MTTQQNEQRRKPTQRGVKIKYDWSALKTDFFKSEYGECKAFFESVFGKFTGHMSKKCIGWPKEKKAWRQQEEERILREIEKDNVNFAVKLHRDVMVAITRMVRTYREGGRLDVDGINTLWRIVRTECGLPSSITKQENLDLGSLDTARDSLDSKLNARQKPTATKKSRAKSVRKPKAKRKSHKG